MAEYDFHFTAAVMDGIFGEVIEARGAWDALITSNKAQAAIPTQKQKLTRCLLKRSIRSLVRI